MREPTADALTSAVVQEAWRDVGNWTDARVESEYERFCERQPALAAYLLALLEDEPDPVMALGLNLALTLDRAYQLAFGSPPAPLEEDALLAAAEASEERFLAASHAQPEMFMRSLLHSREFAAPQLPVELIGILFATVDATPEIEASEAAPLLFLIYSLARIFEGGQGLASAAPLHSLGSEIQERSSQSSPKVGRNEPCPCGSGKKFKHCCLELTAPPAHEPMTPQQQRFAEYFACTEEILAFAEADRSRDGAWHSRQLAAFEERYPSGEDGVLPDSIQINYALFDLELPRARATMAALYGRRCGKQLDAKARRMLRELCDSYLAFYELTGSAEGRQTFRELMTEREWRGSDVDAPDDYAFESGEIWLCRFVGPSDDAIAFGQPLVYPPEAREEIEETLAAIVADYRDANPDQSDAPFATLMKCLGEVLASYIALTAPDDDDEDDDMSDEEDEMPGGDDDDLDEEIDDPEDEDEEDDLAEDEEDDDEDEEDDDEDDEDFDEDEDDEGDLFQRDDDEDDEDADSDDEDEDDD